MRNIMIFEHTGHGQTVYIFVISPKVMRKDAGSDR